MNSQLESYHTVSEIKQLVKNKLRNSIYGKKSMWSKLKRILWERRGLIITIPSIAGLAIAVNSLGLFQLLELATLDRFFQLRQKEPSDPRIAIVTVDESDITYIKQWPISDSKLAQLIENIKKQQPRAIGLDIYRDVPLEPGYQQLVKVFQSTPNLIGVEKVVGNQVAPSPILSKLGQIGIADLVLDSDGKVRRGLLSIKTDDGQTKLSLGTTLALMYLEKEGIKLRQIDPKKKYLGLGKAVFVPFTGNEGSYVRANAGGYQILLNWRGMLENFTTISMKDVLENKIPPKLLENRIVFIGATGSSLNDIFFTPYSSNPFGSPKRTPGVVIHANLTSQILSAALDGRAFLQVWPKPIEWLWTLSWSAIGVTVSWYLLKAKPLLLVNNPALKWIILGSSIFVMGGILIGSNYLAFQVSWWLPTFPPLVALTLSAIAIAASHSLELQREKNDLEILLETTTEHSDILAAELEQKAEEVVRESERKLAQFLEAVPIGVAVIDAESQIYYLNIAAQSLLGREINRNAKAVHFSDVYKTYIAGTNQPYPLENSPINKALMGENSTADNIEIHDGDKIIPIEAWATPIYNESGDIDYALLVFRDITERQKAEAERMKLTNELIQLNVAYSRFVPRQFLQILNKESIINVELGDQVQKTMSVLFSDIRDFTTVSEMMTPEDNFKFINAYLSRMESAIIEHHGFIDKYIGDAIMALFSGEADNAVKAAIAMLHRLTEYNTTRGRPGRPQINIGIGINTGLMMLGTVGGYSRMDGTVISDAVNLASRIEGLTKNYGVALLISHHTFLALNNAEDYAIRLIDKVKVKGKSEMVTVYEVFDAELDEIKAGKILTKTDFEHALLLYTLENFTEAAKIFKHCLQVNPKDKVAKIYWQRCQDRHQGKGGEEENRSGFL